jgi:hypothetical protein
MHNRMNGYGVTAFIFAADLSQSKGLQVMSAALVKEPASGCPSVLTNQGVATLPDAVAEPELASFYTIAGRLIRLEACDDWAARWVTNFFNGFYLLKTAAPANGRAAITLRIGRGGALDVPPGLQSFAVNRGLCHTDGARYYLAVDESLVVVAEPAAKLVDVRFGLTPHARHPIALVNVFSYGLQAALRRAGVYDMHAGGAQLPGSDRGALFVGASGSGKSTLTVKLAARGWRYLSDDMVVLRETPTGLAAEGLRRLFAVTEASITGNNLPRLDEALGAPVASDPTKRRLEPELVFPAGRVASCRPVALFFPSVTSATETLIKEMSARAAMQQLVRFCPWATYDAPTAPDYLRMLARLANQCQSFELSAGRDILKEPARAESLLAPYLEG